MKTNKQKRRKKRKKQGKKEKKLTNYNVSLLVGYFWECDTTSSTFFLSFVWLDIVSAV